MTEDKDKKSDAPKLSAGFAERMRDNSGIKIIKKDDKPKK